MEQILLQITNSITNAIETKYETFANLAPYILGAIAVFLFGWILAEMASRAIIGMSSKLKLDFISDKIGLKHFLQRANSRMSPSQFIAKSVKGYLIFLFFIEATKVAKLTEIAEFLTAVISYVPEVIIALFIILVGIRIGNTMQSLISTSLNFAKSNTADVLGMAAKYAILTFALLAALSQLQIAEILIQTLFIGFVAMLTIAGGLAFGLGGKDVVKELLDAIKEVRVNKHHKE